MSFSETEKEMVSVERAVQYIDTMPAETDDGTAQVCIAHQITIYL